MPPLAELQRAMTVALLQGGGWDAPPTLVPGPISAKAAFDVHCGTVHGALAGALRITFPTVDTLVGGDFFDQAARAYAAEHPPRRAKLCDYGEAFPDFLEAYALARDLTYLGDVARLDQTVGAALRAPDAGVRRHVAIEPSVGLTLPMSLKVLTLSYPADLIRAAIDAGDDQALSEIDLTAARRDVAVWRDGRNARVRPLSRPAGVFLGAVLGGVTMDAALSQAQAADTPQTVLQAIQTEVFTAHFAEITTTPDPDHAP